MAGPAARIAGLALGVLLLAAAGPAPLPAQGCLGCHGPEGRGSGAVPALAGREAAEIIAAMQAFQAGQRPATIMDRIARGYTAAEIAAVAAYFAAP
jgi:cytochrome subunit of sulfide dehydrogenase